ncbi:MAG TPA: DUF2231 domain-containing protein [Melioribacteraceae bacterium]|nr:DUF2231 domain-containing protein [Melioribacteraceae bacterium]
MEFLAGLHPKVIHFPIAFFILYFIFETAGIILKKEYLNKSAFIILALAVFFSIVAVLTGNQAHEMVKQIQADAALYNELIDKHELFSTITLWYFLALLIARTYLTVKKKFADKLRYLFVLLGLIGTVLIYLTATYGGELVFKYGIGTKLF